MVFCFGVPISSIIELEVTEYPRLECWAQDRLTVLCSLHFSWGRVKKEGPYQYELSVVCFSWVKHWKPSSQHDNGWEWNLCEVRRSWEWLFHYEIIASFPGFFWEAIHKYLLDLDGLWMTNEILFYSSQAWWVSEFVGVTFKSMGYSKIAVSPKLSPQCEWVHMEAVYWRALWLLGSSMG